MTEQSRVDYVDIVYTDQSARIAELEDKLARYEQAALELPETPKSYYDEGSDIGWVERAKYDALRDFAVALKVENARLIENIVTQSKLELDLREHGQGVTCADERRVRDCGEPVGCEAQSGFSETGSDAIQVPVPAAPEPAPSELPLTDEKILQAVARGWAHPCNASKEMDADLAGAISNEISG